MQQNTVIRNKTSIRNTVIRNTVIENTIQGPSERKDQLCGSCCVQPTPEETAKKMVTAKRFRLTSTMQPGTSLGIDAGTTSGCLTCLHVPAFHL